MDRDDTGGCVPVCWCLSISFLSSTQEAVATIPPIHQQLQRACFFSSTSHSSSFMLFILIYFYYRWLFFSGGFLNTPR